MGGPDSSRVEIDKRIVLVNAASAVVRSALALSVLVWMHQYLVRSISPEEYSLYPVLMAVMLVFPVLTTVLSAGLARYVTAAYARGEQGEVTRIMSTMLPLLAAVSIGVLAVGGLLAWNIDAVLDIAPDRLEDARFMFALLIFGAAFRIVMAPLGLGFNVRQKFLLRNVIGLLAELLRVGLLLILLIAVSVEVRWVVVALVVANILEFAVVAVWSRRLVPALTWRPGMFSPPLARELLGYGGWAVVGRITLTLRDAADPIILNRLSTDVQVTAFSLGALVETHLRATFLAASSTAQPAITAMEATGQQDRLRLTFFRMCRIALWVLAAGAVPLMLFGTEFFALYLKEKSTLYAAAVAVMTMLLARTIVIFPNSVVSMLAVAKAEVRSVALRTLTLESANLALTLYLVGSLGMGAIGSALSTLTITVVGVPALLWSLGLRLSGAPLGSWLAEAGLRGITPALCAVPAWLAMRWALPAVSWPTLIIDFAVGWIVYLVALGVLAMTEQDRADTARAWQRARQLLRR